MNKESKNKMSFYTYKNSFFINNMQINIIKNIQHTLKLKKDAINIEGHMKKSILSLIFYNFLV